MLYIYITFDSFGIVAETFLAFCCRTIINQLKFVSKAKQTSQNSVDHVLYDHLKQTQTHNRSISFYEQLKICLCFQNSFWHGL